MKYRKIIWSENPSTIVNNELTPLFVCDERAIPEFYHFVLGNILSINQINCAFRLFIWVLKNNRKSAHWNRNFDWRS